MRLINAAANFVALQRRARIYFVITWGKYPHGSAGITTRTMRKKSKEVLIGIRVRKPWLSPGFSAAENAFDTFLMLVHELWHAREMHNGTLTTSSNHKIPWKDRPQEVRAMARHGAVARVILEGNFKKSGTNEANARKAILDLSDEFRKMGSLG